MKKLKAFSAIEVTIATIVVGVLAALTLPKLPAVIENQKVSSAKKVLYDLYASQKRYYSSHGNYAASKNDLDVTFKAPEGFDLTVSNNTNQIALLQRSSKSYGLSVNAAGSINCEGNGCGNIHTPNAPGAVTDYTYTPPSNNPNGPTVPDYTPPPILSSDCVSEGCPAASTKACGEEIIDNCGNSCERGTQCEQGLECQNNECKCVPAECPAPSTVQCGESITNNCGEKCSNDKGTYCEDPETECQGSKCKLINNEKEECNVFKLRTWDTCFWNLLKKI